MLQQLNLCERLFQTANGQCVHLIHAVALACWLLLQIHSLSNSLSLQLLLLFFQLRTSRMIRIPCPWLVRSGIEPRSSGSDALGRGGDHLVPLRARILVAEGIDHLSIAGSAGPGLVVFLELSALDYSRWAKRLRAHSEQK